MTKQSTSVDPAERRRLFAEAQRLFARAHAGAVLRGAESDRRHERARRRRQGLAPRAERALERGATVRAAPRRIRGGDAFLCAVSSFGACSSAFLFVLSCRRPPWCSFVSRRRRRLRHGADRRQTQTRLRPSGIASDSISRLVAPGDLDDWAVRTFDLGQSSRFGRPSPASSPTDAQHGGACGTGASDRDRCRLAARRVHRHAAAIRAIAANRHGRVRRARLLSADHRHAGAALSSARPPAGCPWRPAIWRLPTLALALPLAAMLERLQSQAAAEAFAAPDIVAAAARGVPLAASSGCTRRAGPAAGARRRRHRRRHACSADRLPSKPSRRGRDSDG